VQSHIVRKESSMGEWAGPEQIKVYTVGVCFPIRGVKKLHSPRGTVFVDRQTEVVPTWPLDSVDYALAEWPVPDGLEYYTEAYMDRNGRVFSESSRRTDAISYRIEPVGQFVLEGMPRGKVCYVDRFLRGGYSYVNIDHAYHDSFVFATAKDVGTLLPSMSLHTGKWFSMRSILSTAIDPQYGGQMSMSVLTSSINDIMGRCQPESFGSSGVTALQIADQTGAPVQMLFRQLAKDPVYIMWKTGLGHEAEFVKRENILIRFPGEQIETDHFCVDGRTWADVLEHLTCDTKCVSFVGIPRHFITVLHYNGYIVSYESRGVYYLLHVKIPRIT